MPPPADNEFSGHELVNEERRPRIPVLGEGDEVRIDEPFDDDGELALAKRQEPVAGDRFRARAGEGADGCGDVVRQGAHSVATNLW